MIFICLLILIKLTLTLSLSLARSSTLFLLLSLSVYFTRYLQFALVGGIKEFFFRKFFSNEKEWHFLLRLFGVRDFILLWDLRSRQFYDCVIFSIVCAFYLVLVLIVLIVGQVKDFGCVNATAVKTHACLVF